MLEKIRTIFEFSSEGYIFSVFIDVLALMKINFVELRSNLKLNHNQPTETDNRYRAQREYLVEQSKQFCFYSLIESRCFSLLGNVGPTLIPKVEWHLGA